MSIVRRISLFNSFIFECHFLVLVLGNIYCDKCQVIFKNKNWWLSHMKSFHREEFDEIVSEQRLKRDIFNKNLDQINEDIEVYHRSCLNHYTNSLN